MAESWSLTELLFVLLSFASYVGAVGCHLFMVNMTNRKLARGKELSYFKYFRGWREYKHFYPRSKVYALAVSLTISTIAFGIGWVVTRALEIRGPK
jgi:hypothetical protein